MRLTSAVEEHQDRLFLFLLLARLLLSKGSPDIECQAVLALGRASTARERINDTLRLGREAREIDRLSRSLRTIAGVMLLVTGYQRTRIGSSEHSDRKTY